MSSLPAHPTWEPYTVHRYEHSRASRGFSLPALVALPRVRRWGGGTALALLEGLVDLTRSQVRLHQLHARDGSTTVAILLVDVTRGRCRGHLSGRSRHRQRVREVVEAVSSARLRGRQHRGAVGSDCGRSRQRRLMPTKTNLTNAASFRLYLVVAFKWRRVMRVASCGPVPPMWEALTAKGIRACAYRSTSRMS